MALLAQRTPCCKNGIHVIIIFSSPYIKQITTIQAHYLRLFQIGCNSIMITPSEYNCQAKGSEQWKADK